ncbi:peptide chain release factor N(5)-glutamine methyltransferase [Staphylococcus auricularis]|uniref:Release factor glutamine methyltransferase n=1 Tax=Staphylococcus auricularis TaxID=29379 RepID=A0ABX5II95_9STAP|nr:peptide chain release factor N(5)-glutamine methyltransferase [Staphylococcus auricularis]MEB6570978.1 peptide chain release factor N(5)-glutamine methyltransferase [Staphylococcus auricularis]PTH19461.1 peptide chain release factor N(5)-glutamine methyltransferase [Staphylococcus auricularis]PTH26707.1 peptide chain release factor N(5)-glutamine methyltransferase [Staphylococcus auricularis]
MVNYKTALETAQQQAQQQGFEASRAEWLLLDCLRWNRTQLIMHLNDDMPESHVEMYEQAVERMLKGEPIQYIVGFQSFYGETFEVTPDCLIPRPETEEVMLYFLEQLKEGERVVDIGTGSGVLPIMLKRLMPSLDVYATDLYQAPLEVAKRNADHHQVEIQWLQGDVLTPLIERNIKVDGLISNPPYISQNERNVMDQSVIDYEPSHALFAENDGYAIYEKILQQLPHVLNAGAHVVFEIGYQQADYLKQFIQNLYPSIMVNVVKDMNGNDRILAFQWLAEP